MRRTRGTSPLQKRSRPSSARRRFAIDDGFVRLVRQRRSVPDAEAFTGWLESQVLIAYQPSLPGPSYEEFRRRGLERLLERGPREDGTFDQDYIRLDLMVTKPDH